MDDRDTTSRHEDDNGDSLPDAPNVSNGQKPTGATYVYKYGLMWPTINEGSVMDQMWGAYRLYNDLTKIERIHRDCIRTLVDDDPDVIAHKTPLTAVRAQLDDVFVRLRAARVRSRSKEDPPELVAEKNALKAEYYKLLSPLMAARRAAREKYSTEMSQLDQMAKESVTFVEHRSKVFWGTRRIVLRALKQAKSAVGLWNKHGDPGNPHFKVASESYLALAVEFLSTDAGIIQTGKDKGKPRKQKLTPRPEEFIDTKHPWVRICSRDEVAWNGPNKRQSLSLCIGRDGKQAMWATWPMIMDRPFPKNTRVTNVTVYREMIGRRQHWFCTFTLKNDTSATWRTADPPTAEVVTFNGGWRKMDNGEMRVGYVAGSDGILEDIRLPTWITGQLLQVEEVHGRNDKAFNEAHAKLGPHLHKLTNCPAWFTAYTKGYAHWATWRRMEGLYKKWRTDRFDGDKFAWDILHNYRRKNYHYWQWEADMRKDALRARGHFYGEVANRLAEKYGTLVLGRFYMADVVELPELGEPDTTKIQESRHQRFMVAPSILKSRLEQSHRRVGRQVLDYSSTNITQDHHNCGVYQNFDAATNLHWTCSVCNLRYDQDANAALNLLKRYRAGPPTLKPQKKKRRLSSWNKLKNKK